MNHLIYHIWPRIGSNWLWNVEQLLKRIEQFDGVRSIGIAISPDSESAEAVKSAFSGHRIDNWVIEPNDAQRGEGVTFFTMLATLPRTGNTFYAHAKGVSKTPVSPQVTRWAEMMYQSLLDNPSFIRKKLEIFPSVGNFKQHFDKRTCDFGPCDWQFSGTFFWFRNSDALSRLAAFRQIPSYWGVEYWPGQVFKSDEALCLFGENVGGLYHQSEIDRVTPDFNRVMEEQKRKHFCYYTGTNRMADKPMIECMIRSARKSGVTEDFHVFAPFNIADAINHHIPQSRSWNRHMAKIEFLLDLKDTDYEYCTWLDSDNYFVRDPGDLSELIRYEPCWVSMESDLTTPKNRHAEWYGLYFKNRTPTIFDYWQQYGAGRAGFWNCNGGLFIVRRSEIQRFHDECFRVFHGIRANNGPDIPDEVPLAIVGDSMVSDPRLNTFEKHSHIWACDWHSTFTRQLPEGLAWRAKDYITDEPGEMINPAIVHLMKGKHLMQAAKTPWIESVPGLSQLRAIPLAQSIEERMISHLRAFPCKFRGELLRIDARDGGCAVSPSPVFECRLESNEAHEASMWKFCREQELKMCHGCAERIEPELVQIQKADRQTAIHQPHAPTPDGRIPSQLRRHNA